MVPPKELVAMFEKVRGQDISLEEVRPQIREQGWTDSEIDAAYNAVFAEHEGADIQELLHMAQGMESEATPTGSVPVGAGSILPDKKQSSFGLIAKVISIVAILGFVGGGYFVYAYYYADKGDKQPAQEEAPATDQGAENTNEVVEQLTILEGSHNIEKSGTRNSLAHYTIDPIPDVVVTSVRREGDDIIVEGSGFLKLNREPKIEGDTCIAKVNNLGYKYSVGNTRITMTKYATCLPDGEEHHLSVRRYEHQKVLFEQDYYKDLYVSLGGTGLLEQVITYNRYKIVEVDVPETITEDDVPEQSEPVTTDEAMTAPVTINVPEESVSEKNSETTEHRALTESPIFEGMSMTEMIESDAEILEYLGIVDYLPLADLYDDWSEVMSQGDADTLFFLQCAKQNILDIENYASEQELRALRAEMSLLIHEPADYDNVLTELGDTYVQWYEIVGAKAEECDQTKSEEPAEPVSDPAVIQSQDASSCGIVAVTGNELFAGQYSEGVAAVLRCFTDAFLDCEQKQIQLIEDGDEYNLAVRGQINDTCQVYRAMEGELSKTCNYPLQDNEDLAQKAELENDPERLLMIFIGFTMDTESYRDNESGVETQLLCDEIGIDEPEIIENNTNPLTILSGEHYIRHGEYGTELIYYDTDPIEGVVVESVRREEDDILIEGSGIMSLNYETKLEGDTCLTKFNSQGFTYSVNDEKQTLGQYAICLPNTEEHYLSVRDYDYKKSLHELDYYKELYKDLGGKWSLEKVIMANRYKIEG